MARGLAVLLSHGATPVLMLCFIDLGHHREPGDFTPSAKPWLRHRNFRSPQGSRYMTLCLHDLALAETLGGLTRGLMAE